MLPYRHLNNYRDFPAFQYLGPGALDFGKKLRANLSNWENLIESLKQYVNILAFLLPAQQSSSHFYTPGIYANGYIVFAFPFVRSSVRMFVSSFVRTSVTFVEFASKFCVKVSHAVYISATTHQKAFIFGP